MLPRLRRFAIGLCGNPADGDDLCQTSLERALANRDKWRAGTRLDSWMYRIMRNLWIDQGRASARRRETFVEEDAGFAVGGERGFDLERARPRQLAIGESGQFVAADGHADSPSIANNASRPRTSRELSVPTGQPAISAASL